MTMPPLLAMAEGRKLRPRKAPVIRPKEFVLHYAVAKLLNDYANPEWIWTHFPSGEHRDERDGAKLKRFGLKRGWPDFLLLAPAGDYHIHGLELKRIGEHLTHDQAKIRDWILAHRGRYAVCRTIDDVLAAGAEWGCLLVARP